MRYLLGIIFFAVASLLFMILEYGRFAFLMDELIQPVIFAFIATSVFINYKCRRFVLLFSLMMLIMMVVFYLFNLVSISNWIGSLGVGILVILVFSYLPNLIKNGHI